MSTTAENIRLVRDLLIKDGEDPEKFFPSCVGCRYCCKQATCSLGIKFYGAQYPCPALFWNGERYMCKMAKTFSDDLYIGSGCCSPLNSWRKEVKERDGTTEQISKRQLQTKV